MQIWRRIGARLFPAHLHSRLVSIGLSDEKVSGSLQLFAVFLQTQRWRCILNWHSFLWLLHPSSGSEGKQCNKQGLKCIVKNKGDKIAIHFYELFTHQSSSCFSNHRRSWNFRVFVLEGLQRGSLFEAVIEHNVLVPQLESLVDDAADQSDLQARTHSRLRRGFGVNWRKLVAVLGHE